MHHMHGEQFLVLGWLRTILFHPSSGGHVAHMVHHNVTQNVKKHY